MLLGIGVVVRLRIEIQHLAAAAAGPIVAGFQIGVENADLIRRGGGNGPVLDLDVDGDAAVAADRINRNVLMEGIPSPSPPRRGCRADGYPQLR